MHTVYNRFPMSSLRLFQYQNVFFSVLMLYFIATTTAFSTTLPFLPTSSSSSMMQNHPPLPSTTLPSKILLPTTTTNTISRTKVILHSSSTPPPPPPKKKSSSSGVYSRPSAAIERGSGFFVPGLEGSRVRILFGILVLILAFVNHVTAPLTELNTSGQSVSEAVAAFYGVLLLVQAFSEVGKERGFGVDLSSSSSSTEEKKEGVSSGSSGVATGGGGVVQQKASSQLSNILTNDTGIDAIKWVAASYVALTPATHVLLIGEEDVYYSLGPDLTTTQNHPKKEEQQGIAAAIRDVYNSQGGRISIPSDHPASVSLVPEEFRRCVLLQRIETMEKKKYCLLIGSNQLLQAFTKNDLRWLGRLSLYVGSSLK